RWIGCIEMPAATPANSVATYSDGTVLASVLTHPGTSITDFVRGDATGGVYEWRPGEAAFRLLPGTRLPGNNGIETSPDDREFYVVAFGSHAVVIYARDDTSQPLTRRLWNSQCLPTQHRTPASTASPRHASSAASCGLRRTRASASQFERCQGLPTTVSERRAARLRGEAGRLIVCTH